MEEYGLPSHDATLLTATKASADFYEEAVSLGANAKNVSNWMIVELASYLNAENLEIDECAVTPRHIAELVKMIDAGTISGKIAKDIFGEMFETGKLPSIIVEERGLIQISDESEIAAIVEAVIEENPKSVEDYRGGKQQALGFLVGQVMRLTKGRANPALVNKLLKEKLS